MCVGLPVLFRDRLDVSGRFATTFAGASYAVYVIHPYFVVGLQVLILGAANPGTGQVLHRHCRIVAGVLRYRGDSQDGARGEARVVTRSRLVFVRCAKPPNEVPSEIHLVPSLQLLPHRMLDETMNLELRGESLSQGALPADPRGRVGE